MKKKPGTIAMENRPAETAEAIASHVSSPLLAAGPSGRVVFSNRAAERVWGYSEGGMMGVSFNALVANAKEYDLCTTTPAHRSCDDIFVVEAEGVRRDGETFPLELQIAHADDLVIVAARDITQRRRAEMELWHAVEVANANARAKSDLLATLSHEIRTPMGAVLGWIEVLRDTDLDGDQRRLCEAIDRNSNALMTLLNDILDYAKGEAHKIRLEPAAFDLPALLAEVGELFAESAARKEIGFDLRIDQRLPTVIEGDPRRLRQVLINLVANAIKFTGEGRVMVRVGTEDGRQCRFEISDTGIGVPEEARSKLFQAFTQASSSAYGGSGLGLAICRQLVELMNGEIGFESRTGQGSTFWFTLPLVARPQTPPTETLPKRLRVLIAEDNLANRVVAEGLLEKLGHEAISVNNGVEAIDAIERERFHVVLMDIWMPEMDGLAATRRIAELYPPGKRPRIIALTADATPETRTRCALAGMIDYVTKPLDLERLRYALGRAAAQLPH